MSHEACGSRLRRHSKSKMFIELLLYLELLSCLSYLSGQQGLVDGLDNPRRIALKGDNPPFFCQNSHILPIHGPEVVQQVRTRELPASLQFCGFDLETLP